MHTFVAARLNVPMTTSLSCLQISALRFTGRIGKLQKADMLHVMTWDEWEPINVKAAQQAAVAGYRPYSWRHLS